MKQIRKGVFETNSSSTHALSISGDSLNDIPEDLHFECGEFGWECETYVDVQTKASYLWTYIFNKYSNYYYPKKEDGTEDRNALPVYTFTDEFYKWKELLKKVCEEVGIKNVTFQEGVRKKGFWYDSGYIDHSYDLGEFMDHLKEDRYHLKQFLFCNDSGIESGNDNDDWDVNSPSQNPIYEYYKGN